MSKGKIDQKIYRQLNGPRIVYNHLPGIGTLLDLNQLYQIVKNRLHDQVYDIFLVQYILPEEKPLLSKHMQYITDCNLDLNLERRAKLPSIYQRASFSQKSIIQDYIDQDKENDAIWSNKFTLSKFSNRMSVSSQFSSSSKMSPTLQLNKQKIQLMSQIHSKTQFSPQVKRANDRLRNSQISLEFESTPPGQNRGNSWVIKETRNQITKASEIPHFKCIVQKRCEMPFINVQSQHVVFNYFALVSSSSDLYIYQIPLIELQGELLNRDIQVARARDGYSDMQDCNYLLINELERDYDPPMRVFRKKVIPNIISSIRSCVSVLGQQLLSMTPCGSSYELLKFSFGLRSQNEQYKPFLMSIESTPGFEINNAFALSLYPKLIDDMYDIVIDKIFPDNATNETEKQDENCQISDDNKFDVFQIYQQEVNLIRNTIMKDRKINGLRYIGGRQENWFKRYDRWGK